jgi:hypothetical protein
MGFLCTVETLLLWETSPTPVPTEPQAEVSLRTRNSQDSHHNGGGNEQTGAFRRVMIIK